MRQMAVKVVSAIFQGAARSARVSRPVDRSTTTIVRQQVPGLFRLEKNANG